MQREEEFFAICRAELDHDGLVPDLPPEKSKLFCGFNELLHSDLLAGGSVQSESR